MPTMLNPRSLALMNANPRLLTSPNAGVILNPSSEFFHINNSGINDPAIITFNAMLIAMEGTVTFSCTGGTLTNIVGNTCALTYENMTGETATVKASITYRNEVKEDTVEIRKSYDGENGTAGLNNALVYAYQRSVTTPTGSPGVVEYSFPAAGITTANLANGWKKTIPAGTDPLWITAASASASGSLDAIQANEWTSPVILAQNGAQGTNGVNSAIVTIYRRTTTTSAPTLPSVATEYTFSPGGLTGLNNSWTTTLPPMSNGQYLWASTATAVSTSATDSIPASEWAAAQMLVQNGANGSRGNVIVARAIPGTIWSDSEAALAISGQGYGTPQNRDIVTLYNSAANYSEQKYYDGSAWQALGAYFPGSVIVDKTLDASALKANTITGDKIKAGAITASSISVSSNPDNILPDPRFKDLSWWGVLGQNVAVGDWIGFNTFWSDHASLYLYPLALTTHYSSWFTVQKGAKYRLETQIYLPDDFAGQLSVYLEFENVNTFSINQPQLYNWSHIALPVQHDNNSPRGFRSFAFSGYDVPSYSSGRARVVIIRKVDAGWAEIGGIRITRMSDNVLIADGAVTANKITASSVSAITGLFGTMRTADSGARIEVKDNLIEGFQWNNVRRFRLSA